MECTVQSSKTISLKQFELQEDETETSREHGHSIMLLSFVKKKQRDKHICMQSEVSRSL
jgi:hypothetical protein